MLINGKEVEINRNNAKVSEWDHTYCRVVRDVIKYGEFTENRTGTDTLAIEGVNFKLNVGETFPILESKKVNHINALTELLWIYQAQTNKVSWLHERNNHIWDDWIVSDDGYWHYTECEKQPDGRILRVPKKKYFGEKYIGTDGKAYGAVLDETKDVDKVLYDLKHNPTSRRMNISLWQSELIKEAVLPPCVWSSTYKLYKGKLNSVVTVRSNDMPAGNPFNVTQYAILLSLFAKVSGLEVGNMTFSITDCHIYVDQLKGIKLQLERYDRMCKWEEFIQTNTDSVIEQTYNELVTRLEFLENKIGANPLMKDGYQEIYRETKEEKMVLEHMLTRQNPVLWLADKDDFYAFDNSEDNKDIKVLNYTHLPFIKMPVAQ